MSHRFGSSVSYPMVAGRIMIGIGILGLLVTVVGTLVGWQLVTDLHAGVGRSLEVTGEVLETVDESFVVAEDALGILGEGVAEAEGAVRALGRSLREGQDALASATRLTGGDVADALESVEQGLPAMQAAAETIDDTLSALSRLPIPLSYDPEHPLGESIGALREDLDGLPDELREQAEQVERTSEELTAATEGTLAMADSLGQLQERVAETTELVGQYQLRAREARTLVTEQAESLSGSAARARVLVVAFGLVFAASQFVPLYLGHWLQNADVEVRRLRQARSTTDR